MMAEATVDIPSQDVRLRARNPARRGLLDAARSIAARKGIAGISLSAVAEEAGFARATAYAHFRGKDDLLQSIVAEDLAFLVRAMRLSAGLPEPPQHPAPPSRIVRIDFQPIREKPAQAEEPTTADAEQIEQSAHSLQTEPEQHQPIEQLQTTGYAGQTENGQSARVEQLATPGAIETIEQVEPTEPASEPTVLSEPMEPEERSSTSAVQFVTSWQFETLEQDEPSEPEPANQPQTEESEPDAQVEQGEGAKLSEPAEQVLTAGPIETDDEPEPVAEVETVEQSFDQPEHAEHAEPTVQPSPEVQNDAFDIEETAITTQETYAVRDVWEDEEPEETAAESEIDDDELTGRVGPEEASQAESETLAPQAGVQEQALRDEISLGSATWDTKSGRSTERSEKKDEAAPSTARLAPRLPSREDRLLLTGKRALATPELRDTLKRLAPAFPTDGETPSDAVARLEKVVAKVDPDHVARIERRLAMLERNVAGIEERATQAAAEHSGADESSKVELGNVVDRLEGFERRQRGMMLKMMAEIRDTSRRLDAIETAKRLASAMADPEATVEPKSSEPDPAGSLENLETILLNDEVPSDTELETPSSASFLTHARRAAMSAVTSQLDTESIEADAKRRARRNRLIVGGIVAAALVLGGTAIVLRQAGSDAVPTAQMQQHANGQDFQRSTKLTRGASGPIDQLTARAGAGDTQAELIVGLKYLAGEGVSKNESSGAKWIARAALKGNTLAQYWLATLYERGRGVTADPVQAFAWYEKAAIGGNRKAMHNLAVAYAQGKGVGSNMAESARWFSQAASLGYVDSAFNLAVLYERGDGVPQSLLDAYKWYAIAANEGDTEAKTRMSAIESELSPDALDAAQKAASTFKPQQLQANASSNVRKASSSLAQ